jgi:hypothetical protein
LLQSPEACPSLQKWIAESILENNPIAAWLDAQCIVDKTARTQIGIAEEFTFSTTNEGATRTMRVFKNSENWLYANYAQFCRDTGIQRISAKRFSNLLLDLLQNQLHINTNKGRDRSGAFIEGIRLRLPSDPENYPITGAKIQIVTDDVLDCDGCVTAETIDGDGCDGCDGLNQVFSQKNILNDSLEKIEKIPLRLPKNPSHPSHPSPEPILAITQPVTVLNQSVTLDEDDEWIDIDSSVVPTKKTLKTGDKVRYVGQKYSAIYGNKELIVNSVGSYEIDCLLPDGSYTTKFKIHDRDLELDRAAAYF